MVLLVDHGNLNLKLPACNSFFSLCLKELLVDRDRDTVSLSSRRARDVLQASRTAIIAVNKVSMWFQAISAVTEQPYFFCGGEV